MPAHALIFHYFEDGEHPSSQGSLTTDAMETLLRRIEAQRILPAREWLERAAAGTLNDEHICLSFDDGLRCQYDVALPVLRRLGLTALWFPYTSSLEGFVDRHEVYRHFRALRYPQVDAFYRAFDQASAVSAYAEKIKAGLDGFVPADYLKQYAFYSDADRIFRFVRDKVLGEAGYFDVMDGMIAADGMDMAGLAGRLWINRDQLATLSAEGHVIGLHSHQHPLRAATLAPQERRQDYMRNFELVRDVSGQPPICVAYACNTYDAETIDFLGGLGIRVGFCNVMAGDGGPMNMPRQDYSLAT